MEADVDVVQLDLRFVGNRGMPGPNKNSGCESRLLKRSLISISLTKFSELEGVASVFARDLTLAILIARS